MIQTQGCIKNYHWGKTGDDNYIARFRDVADRKLKAILKEDCNSNDPQIAKRHRSSDTGTEPLAELWFGAHPSGPATVTVDKQLVKFDAFIAEQPYMIGTIDLYEKNRKTLPFLLKILSVAQPLSLQAHPDKKLAEVLHHRSPTKYPDSNHKPELAIALTEFEVLCDFRPKSEIAAYLSACLPLRNLIGQDLCQDFERSISQTAVLEHQNAWLPKCFKSLMTSKKEDIAREAKNLIQKPTCEQELVELVAHLNRLYPGDPGVFAPFFLNHIKLKPGEAIYMRPNKLHAYISGECIECMACSDNVVRAGLTTKYRDVETLLNMLDYETVQDRRSKNPCLFHGHTADHNTKDSSVITYAPTEEFKVDVIKITDKNAPKRSYKLPPMPSGSFILVFGPGSARAKDFFDSMKVHKLGLGTAGFIPPKIPLELNDIHGSLTIFRSYC